MYSSSTWPSRFIEALRRTWNSAAGSARSSHTSADCTPAGGAAPRQRAVRNSRSVALKASGLSAFVAWPESGMTTQREPAIARASDSFTSSATVASSAPAITSVGHRTRVSAVLTSKRASARSPAQYARRGRAEARQQRADGVGHRVDGQPARRQRRAVVTGKIDEEQPVVALERGDLPDPVVGAGAEAVQEHDGRGGGRTPAATLVVDVRPLRRRWRPSPRTSSAGLWARRSRRSRTSGAPAPSTGTPAPPGASDSTRLPGARRGIRVRDSGPHAW